MPGEQEPDDFDYRSLELKENKYTKFYSETLEKEDQYRRDAGTDIQKELREYKHSDAIDFAAKTWDWDRNTNESLPHKRNVRIPTFKSQQGTRAYYRVLKRKENKYILIACHMNVHGYHRGDLRFVEVNNRTILKGLHKVSVIGMLFPGDVVAVTNMGKKSRVESVPPLVINVNPDTDCTWEVQNMTLLTRRKENREVSFAILENGLAVVEGRGEAMDVIEDSKNKPLKIDTMYSGLAFIPEKMELNFTEDFHRKFENPLTALSSYLPSYSNSLATIFSYDVCETQSRLFEIGTEAFDSKTFLSHSKEADEVVEKCVRMGASAAQTVSNRRFDARGFPMKDIEQEGLIVRFSISNPPIKPTENLWTTNNRIILSGREGNINAIIETVVLASNRKTIRIAARLSKNSPKGMKFGGTWIVHQHQFPELLKLESGFLKKLHSSSNGRKVIETLYGGPVITANFERIDKERIFVFPSEAPVELNEYQNLYVSMILAGVPLVLGNSPFGCGKSMTIITAAIEVHKQNCRFNNHGKQKQQLLITQTNNAGVSLIDIARKVVADVRVKFLRYVTESNWEILPESSRTVFDMPVLMQDLFVDWATQSPNLPKEFGTLTMDTKKAIVRKVTQKYLKPDKLVGEAKRIYENLKERQKRIEPSPRILRSAFFTIYQPDIIVTTADSLHALLLVDVLKCISNVQIDEASQLPEHTLVYLLQNFTQAGFGLVGDIKQLPPHCEPELVGRLKAYGIGNTMERALKHEMFPESVLRYVYRCHPVTTNLLSDLFYNGRLISGVRENERNEFMRMRQDIWPNQKHPILVLNHEELGNRMGTSVANESEMQHVSRIVHTLTRKVSGYKLKESDIGVISFYRAQTSLLTEAFRKTDVKCGTVDAFQGTEREVMIVCCTNDKPSDFMKSPNRFNVAMSRARQATIIIGNVRNLRKAIYWRTLVEKARENGCLIDEIENFGDKADSDDRNVLKRVYGAWNDSDDDDDSSDNPSDGGEPEIEEKQKRRHRGGRNRGRRGRDGGAAKEFQQDAQNVSGNMQSTDVAANLRTKRRREQRQRARDRQLQEDQGLPVNTPAVEENPNRRRAARPNQGQRKAIRQREEQEKGQKQQAQPPNQGRKRNRRRNRSHAEFEQKTEDEPVVARINFEKTIAPVVDQVENMHISDAAPSNDPGHDESSEDVLPGRRRFMKNYPK